MCIICVLYVSTMWGGCIRLICLTVLLWCVCIWCVCIWCVCIWCVCLLVLLINNVLNKIYFPYAVSLSFICLLVLLVLHLACLSCLLACPACLLACLLACPSSACLLVLHLIACMSCGPILKKSGISIINKKISTSYTSKHAVLF